MTEAVRVGVVGAGGWGQNHVRTLAGLEGADLRYVCDLDAGARERAQSLAPQARVVDSFDALLADPSLEAVVLASDASTHAELGLAAIAAGKDVLVEKPLALRVADAQALVDAARERERVLMVGHLLLYHPAVTRLRELVDAGRLGELLHLRCERLNLGVLRTQENAWFSLAPHDLSLAHLLFGAEPRDITCQGACLVDPAGGVADLVHAFLRYDGGRVAQIAASWLDPIKTRRLVAVGTRAMAVFDDTLPDKLILHMADLSFPEGAGSAVRFSRAAPEVIDLEAGSALEREERAFLRSVRERSVPLADAESGLAVVRALCAGQRSLDSGGAVVTLESIE